MPLTNADAEKAPVIPELRARLRIIQGTLRRVWGRGGWRAVRE
ncbi:hypothetical protein SCOCK_60173 [Actinacidiphila cocklensis]|uniref:Uncharacterized protein n=1 Tax=Actinacidiphila cocklensis TaxID=887465 RepID=A0A9W4GV12_9ACTN|nr:hypothetical protein SCOCK_60173 [Actinacidiphila cocklensis]